MGFLSGILQTIGDLGVGIADSALGVVGLGNVISDAAYSSSRAAGTQKNIGGVVQGAADILVNTMVPGSGAVLAAVQHVGATAKPNVAAIVNTVAAQQIGTASLQASGQTVIAGTGVIIPVTATDNTGWLRGGTGIFGVYIPNWAFIAVGGLIALFLLFRKKGRR